jgi:hypothetical protein
LPFHPALGIQSSKPMFESLVGLITPATRQNAGKPGIGAPVGGANVPAGIEAATVIVVCGNANAARLSQFSALAGSDEKAKTASTLVVAPELRRLTFVRKPRIVILKHLRCFIAFSGTG